MHGVISLPDATSCDKCISRSHKLYLQNKIGFFSCLKLYQKPIDLDLHCFQEWVYNFENYMCMVCVLGQIQYNLTLCILETPKQAL